MRSLSFNFDESVDLVAEGGRSLHIPADQRDQVDAIASAFFGPEVAPVPARVSARQAWLEMASRPSKTDKTSMLADFKAMAAGAGEEADIEFNKADFYERVSPVLNQIADAYGLSEAEKDDLFRAAILR